MRLWIKDPLAILADGAARGVVVEGSKIVECVGRGASPAKPCEMTFDASHHVMLPGLVNAHHHFYQTLTRAHPAGIGKDLVPWLVAMERVWARMTPEALRIGLVQEVTPRDALLSRAIAIAEKIAAQAPLGVAATLASARVGRDQGEKAAANALRGEVVKLMASDDAREGVQSFVERRAAKFTGK